MSTEISASRPQALATSAEPTVMQILAQAVLSGNVSVDVVERLTKLQREQVEYSAMVEFNEAMHRCQLAMQPIRAEADSDKGKYANYAQVDRVIRPIYTKEGFSLSFSDGEPQAAGWLRLICYVSRGGYVRQYHKDMPLVTTGAKGGQVMTAIHAQGSSDLYAKRYLVGDIFNIAIDKNKDNDGNGSKPLMNEDDFYSWMEAINNAADDEQRGVAYRGAFKEAENINDWKSIEKFKAANNTRKKELSA